MAKRNVEIVIEGMMCTHCTGRVEQALNAVNGVSAKVELEKKTAFVEASDDVSNEALSKVVTDCGYKVLEIR